MSRNSKQSSSEQTKQAAQILNDPNASNISKKLAGSVVAQANTDKQTGAKMETIASNVLKSDKYSETTKSLAASVLAQSNKER